MATSRSFAARLPSGEPRLTDKISAEPAEKRPISARTTFRSRGGESRRSASERDGRTAFYLSICALGAISGCVACGSGESTARTFEEQVEEGGELYGMHCAECHGDAGQGTGDAPRLVGEGALPEEPPAERQFRMNDFKTAADVFAFVSEYMPATDPASVSDAQKVDILAFALYANGVELEAPLTVDSADEVILHE